MGPWTFFLYPKIVDRDEKLYEKESGKSAKVRRSGYVIMVEVKSLTHYFLLQNGEDINIVYNVTHSGLNNSLRPHHFSLPIFGSTIPAVEKGTSMAYWGIGDILLYLILSEEVRPFFGVGVMNVRTG